MIIYESGRVGPQAKYFFGPACELLVSGFPVQCKSGLLAEKHLNK